MKQNKENRALSPIAARNQGVPTLPKSLEEDLELQMKHKPRGHFNFYHIRPSAQNPARTCQTPPPWKL